MELLVEIQKYSPVLYLLLAITAIIIGALFANLSWRKNKVQPISDEVIKNRKIIKHASVILPICGKYDETKQFAVWDSVLHQNYDGEINFLFVVESTQDPAYRHFINYMEYKGFKSEKIQEFQEINIYHQFKLLVSGLSFHNAYKIHNMLHGVDSCCLKTEYLIFLDDDIQINNQTVYNLVHSIECDFSGKTKISTGYSVEIPQKLNLVNYLIMVYRSFNLLGFTGENVNYCWGGCFCLRYHDFSNSKIREIYVDGGYSDDMTLGNLFKQQNYLIVAPQQNMFINRINCTNFAKQYYNYVQRQYFVLNTYFSQKDRIVNLIALLQLLFGGILTLSFVVLIGADIIFEVLKSLFVAYSKDNYHYVLQAKLAFIIACLFTIGGTINGANSALENLVNRMACREKAKAKKLSNLLTAVSLITHFACTPLMILQIFTKRAIYWGSCVFTVYNGKVQHVQRVDRETFKNNQVDKKTSLMSYIGVKQPIQKPDIYQRQE